MTKTISVVISAYTIIANKVFIYFTNAFILQIFEYVFWDSYGAVLGTIDINRYDSCPSKIFSLMG